MRRKSIPFHFYLFASRKSTNESSEKYCTRPRSLIRLLLMNKNWYFRCKQPTERAKGIENEVVNEEIKLFNTLITF